MIQANGYVWFLPGWFKDRWFDLDYLRQGKNEMGQNLPANCTTAKMMEALVTKILQRIRLICNKYTFFTITFQDGAFCLMHNNYGNDTSMTVGGDTVAQWTSKLGKVVPI